MYCPACGAESTQGLNYCKRCGANLGLPTTEIGTRSPAPRHFAILWPVAVVCMTGLIGLFATLVNLAERGVDPRALIGITAFSGATVLGVVGLLIWLLTQLSGIQIIKQRARNVEKPRPDLNQEHLPAPPYSVSSVTENTTRNFEAPVPDRALD